MACSLSSSLLAQKYTDRSLSYRTLTVTRNRPQPFSNVIQLEGSAAFGFAEERDGAPVSVEDEETIDGSLWYHSERFTRNTASIDVYAGRDGAILSVVDKEPPFGTGQRLELFGQYVPFYREGFYEGENFVPTGQFEGTNWGMYLGVGDSPQEGVYFEAGPYFRVFEFDRNERTLPTYTIPDNFFSYGGRLYLEQSTLQLDPESAKPNAGYLLSVMIEREENTSNRTFGVDAVFASSLPSSLWRARAHFESYLPTGIGVVELHATGRLTDEDDRVTNYDVQEAGVGQFFIDTEIRLRIELGPFEITPLGKYRHQQVAREFGVGESLENQFGGGLYIAYKYGDLLEIFADYSYFEDANRVPISWEQDTLSEHQLFLGGRVRLGAQRASF